MLHAFCADESIRQLLDIFRLAAKHDYFQAAFVVEMRVQSRNDDCMMLMLQIGKLLRQQTRVMIVDQGHRAHHKRISSDHDRTYQPVTNQIAECLRTVLIALVSYERIKPAQ